MTTTKTPPKQKPKTQEKFIGFFMTSKQNALIRKKAKDQRQNITDYIRYAAISGTIKQRWTSEQRHLLSSLANLSSGINEVTAKAKQEGMLKAILSFASYQVTLNDIFKQIKYVKQDL